MQSSLGIDVSKKTLDAILLIDQRSYHKVFSNDHKGYQFLEKWLITHKVSQVHTCLEATGQYGEGVAEYLYKQNYLVSIVNPARIKRYGQSKLHRNKTDKADAALIAEFCLKENPAPWKPLSPEIKHLRALIRRLRGVKTQIQQENNRLKSGERDPWVIDDLTRHMEYLKENVKKIEKEIQECIHQSDTLKTQHDLLTSIPGIGTLTASTLLAEIGDFSVFENAPQLAAYAGLNPKGHRSGTSVFKKSRVSKEGRSELRACLYMPSLVALSYNPVIQALAERLRDSNHHKMEIVVASMKKLLHLAFGVLKNQTPFDPNFGAQFDFSS